MTRVDIKLNFTCNNHCLFCVQGDRRSYEKSKTTQEVKDLLKKSRARRGEVVFTGGEVTTRPDLSELVRYAKQLGFQQIQLQSNGRRFFYKDYCQEMISSGVTQFALALHGATAEVHDELTCAKGSFLQTTTGIKNLASMGQSVLANCVITKKGYKQFPELADLLIGLGVKQYQFAFMHISNVVVDNPSLIEDIVPRKTDVMPYIKKGLQKGIDKGVTVMTEAIPFCLMDGYEKYIAELDKIPSSECYDGEIEISDYALYRRDDGKLRGPKCSECKYFKICEGPWKEYPELFGWEEFVPVKN